MNDRRDEFLLEMYRQMFNDINRHILVVWQSVGVLVGALALYSFVDKGVVSLDLASGLILLLCGWLYGHLLDAAYWYNRNLAIIANVERQFLLQSDLKNIHYYFGEHRTHNRAIAHLRMQQYLAIGLGSLVLAYHFMERVLPSMYGDGTTFDPPRCLPYLLAAAAIVYSVHWTKKGNAKYAEFLKNSPGLFVDTTGIEYGAGTGVRKK